MSSDMGNCGMCEYKSPEEVDQLIERIKAHRCNVCDSDENTLISQHGALYCLSCFTRAHPAAYAHLRESVLNRPREMSALGASTFELARDIVRSQASQYKRENK